MEPWLGAIPSLGSLAVALLAGIALGCAFFGGLWWTVNQLAESDHPALLFAGSFILRTVAVLAGVVLVSSGHWQRIIACVVGFVLVRTLLTRRWGSVQESASIPKADSRAT